MTHYLARNAFNRKQADEPQSIKVLDVCEIKEAENVLKCLFPDGCEVSGIDLFFEGMPKINEFSTAEWVSNAFGLWLGEVTSIKRTTWRDGNGFTLSIRTKPNAMFDPVEGLLKAHRRFSYLKAYEGAEFYVGIAADERAE